MSFFVLKPLQLELGRVMTGITRDSALRHVSSSFRAAILGMWSGSCGWKTSLVGFFPSSLSLFLSPHPPSPISFWAEAHAFGGVLMMCDKLSETVRRFPLVLVGGCRGVSRR